MVRTQAVRTAANIDELLDEAAAIPRAVIILRKLAQFTSRSNANRRTKIGRNNLCPCGLGLGLKYKRCCALN